jgi:hypothetical protein
MANGYAILFLHGSILAATAPSKNINATRQSFLSSPMLAYCRTSLFLQPICFALQIFFGTFSGIRRDTFDPINAASLILTKFKGKAVRGGLLQKFVQLCLSKF